MQAHKRGMQSRLWPGGSWAKSYFYASPRLANVLK